MTATLALSLLLSAAEPAWLAAPPLTAEPSVMLADAAALEAPAGDIDVLLEEGIISFDEQGRASTTYRLVYRARTREGAERWSEVARAWSPWHQARPEVRARVIGRDGAVHPLDPTTLVEAGLGDQEEGLYSDRRVLKGPLPAVDAGAVVEEVETVRDEAPLFEAGAVRRFYVGRDGPVRTIRLRLEAPRGLPLAFALRGGLGGQPRETTEGGRRVLTWRWDQVPPRTPQEAGQPPELAGQPHVAYATARSWKAVAAAYAAVLDRQLAGHDLATVAREVVPKGASRLEAAQAVLEWQRKQVRYTGLELGEAAFVPARPAETLRRRFGDCKDLSLLVAGVLSEAGFPATLALVRVDGDAPADLPGLGEFDHAIVALTGPQPLFLDPTDPVTPAGQLPALLQGRLALVAGKETSGLTRLPEAPADANRIEVTREIRLTENGWADASELERLTGWPATDQRGSVLRLSPGERAERDHELVTSHFVQATGGEVAFDGLDRPGAPVEVKLTGKGSHWAVTRADDGEAVVSMAYLLEWLPRDVKPGPPQEEEGAERKAAGREPPRPRQADLLLPIAYRATLRYLVVPPPGFEVELPLPAPQQLALGPLTAGSRFALEKDGTVTVVHELLVARRRVTGAEVEALRQGLEPLLADEPRLRYTRTAARLLEAGQGREALTELRRLIALHPTEARHWNHLAQALLRLGLGEAAREAARRSVALEPNSSWAHRVLATSLEHDALGRWMTPGCDLAGAVAAQRRAVELEREPAVRAHLAFLLEHGEGCERFGEGARLEEAAASYRIIRNELKSKEYDRAYLAVLLRTGRFADAGPIAKDLPEGPERRAALLAIRAATEGVEPAVKEALRIPSADRAAPLDQAAQSLVVARRYDEAARLLEGGAGGTPQSAQLKARAAILRKVVRSETLRPEPRDPATLPIRLLRAMGEGGEAWKAVPELPPELRVASGEFSEAGLAVFRRALRGVSGLPERVALDAALSLLEVKVEGDPARALRISAATPSIPAPLVFAVVKEKGAWRLVGEEPLWSGLGAAVRRLAAAGDLAGARAALTLARQAAGTGGEGSAAGVLSALAPEGAALELPALQVTGAALQGLTAPTPVRAELEQAHRAATPPARAALAWVLATGAARQARWADVLPLAEELLAAAPTSERAFELQVVALVELSRREALERLVAARLAASPGDAAALRARLSRALHDGDVAEALVQERAIVASGKALPSDHNNLAWALLFQPVVEAQALEQARRAVELTRDREAGFLHTLAAVHAARGEAAEALQILRKAVEQAGPENRPAPHDWLVLGLIAERYGLAEEATRIYRRVTPPEQPDGLSSHELAARRLKALAATPAGRP